MSLTKKYKCSVCDREFALKNSLEIHRLNHKKINNANKCKMQKDVNMHDKKEFLCPLCQKSFSLMSSLTIHMNTHVKSTDLEQKIKNEESNEVDVKPNLGLNDVKCSVCEKTFASNDAYINHQKEHFNEISLEYIDCKTLFISKEILEEHIQTHDSEMVDDPLSLDETVSSHKITAKLKPKILWCTLCEKNFTYEKAFKKHVLTHSAKGSEEFSSVKLLKQHVLSHARKVKNRCTTCKKLFPSHELLQKHMNQDIYHCKICKESFPSCNIYRLHLKSHSRKCNVCGKIFHKLTILKQHVLTHTEEQECTICSKMYPNQWSLHRHVQAIHSENRHDQCDFCGKLYEKRYLKSHILTHTGERPYECDVCGNKFVQRIHLNTHKKIHTGERKYKCDTCHKSFALKSTLTLHLRTHSGEKPFHCGSCSKSFASLSSLKQHKMTHSPSDKYSCQICDKKYAQKYALYCHYKTHSNEELEILNPELLKKISEVGVTKTGKNYSSKVSISNRYQCEYCGKSFHFKVNLQSHILLHTGEKPYSCSDCGKVFRLKYSLKLHERTHTGERPYQCSICNKRFVQYSHAKTHLILHTGQKPFLCPICGKAFADKNNLCIHKKIHAKNSVSKNSRSKDSVLKASVPNAQPSIVSATRDSVSTFTVAETTLNCVCEISFSSRKDLAFHQKSCPQFEALIVQADVEEEIINESCDSDNYVFVEYKEENTVSGNYKSSVGNTPDVQIHISSSDEQPLIPQLILKINPNINDSKEEVIVHEVEDTLVEHEILSVYSDP